MTVDDSSNIIASGNFNYNVPLYSMVNEILTIKYNSHGFLKWVHMSGSNLTASSITTDRAGNIYVNGTYGSPIGIHFREYATYQILRNYNPGNGQKVLRQTSLIEGLYMIN